MKQREGEREMRVRTVMLAFILVSVMGLGAAAEPKGPATRPAEGEMLRPGGGAPVKFQKVTPEEHAAAIAAYKQEAADVSNAIGVKFTTLETPHFLVFNDWDVREERFLKVNVEEAYNAVSREFDIPISNNVFIGKLPVYMFARRDDFMQFVKRVDKIEAVPQGVAGYYRATEGGIGHMVMWKPNPGKTEAETRVAERQWAYTLTHEFTHAFVARYRTNGFIPRWLNEGTAEVVANSVFPDPELSLIARYMAEKYHNVQFVFDDKKFLAAEGYPIVHTMVLALSKDDPKKFLKFFNLIKDGTPGEEALRQVYGIDYKGLERGWRKYVREMR